MTTLRTSLQTSARPWFALTVGLTVVASALLHDNARGVLVAATMFLFIFHSSLLSASASATRRRRGR